jgi:hypothetical protein
MKKTIMIIGLALVPGALTGYLIYKLYRRLT